MPHQRKRGHRGKSPSRESLIADEIRLVPAGSNSGLPAAASFPNSYRVALSNLGFQQVYRLLAERPDVRVERVFEPGPGGESGMTFESGMPLGAFRLIAFSLPYEADYSRAIAAIRNAGIPLRRADRSARDPFILLGGVAITANPRPLEPMADAFLLGECERSLPILLDRLIPALQDESDRGRTLEMLAGVPEKPPGLYVPDRTEIPGPVRLDAGDLDLFPAHSVFLTPHTVFGDTFLVEISRGCDRACSFCLTGHMLHGCRRRSMDAILGQVEEFGSPAGKVGLISAEVSSHPDIERIVARVLGMEKQVTVSSLEADRMTINLLSLLARGGLETLTLAPEAGSDELRREIHKRISNERFLETVALAGRAGIPSLKLYYLAGISEDGEGEVDALVGFTKEVSRVFRAEGGGGGGKTIRVTLSPLVPKPRTPLAGRSMPPVRELRKRVRRARKLLSGIPGVRVSAPGVREAETEHRIGTGDASLFDWLCERASGS